jgi:hypothetical protein
MMQRGEIASRSMTKTSKETKTMVVERGRFTQRMGLVKVSRRKRTRRTRRTRTRRIGRARRTA